MEKSNKILGLNNNVIGKNNTVIGNNNIVNGNRNSVKGNAATVTGDNNQIIGNDTEIKGHNNSAKGGSLRVEGDKNNIIGKHIEIRGSDNTAKGQNLRIEGNKYKIIGNNMESVGNNSSNNVLEGQILQAQRKNKIIVGSSSNNTTGRSNNANEQGSSINRATELASSISNRTGNDNGGTTVLFGRHVTTDESAVPITADPILSNSLQPSVSGNSRRRFPRQINGNVLYSECNGSHRLSRRNSGFHNLPTYVADRETDIICQVCLESIAIGNEAVVLPCCHQYHKNCIDPWLKHSRTCPSCKMKCRS